MLLLLLMLLRLSCFQEGQGSDASAAAAAVIMTTLGRHRVYMQCLRQMSGFSCLVQVGAQVMLLRNLELTGDDRMLVNGSRGVITRFVSKQVQPEGCTLTCSKALSCSLDKQFDFHNQSICPSTPLPRKSNKRGKCPDRLLSRMMYQ